MFGRWCGFQDRAEEWEDDGRGRSMISRDLRYFRKWLKGW